MNLFNMGGFMGFCMGRYQITERRWEIWSGVGWSSAPEAIPQPLGEAFFTSSIYRHGNTHYRFFLQSDPFPLIFGVVSGLPKLGKLDFDVHGAPYNFIFDGSGWKSYFADAYHSQLKAPLIDAWGYAAIFDMDLNGTGQGLLLGLGDPPDASSPPGYHAARYDSQRGAANAGSLWSYWREDGQSTDGKITGE